MSFLFHRIAGICAGPSFLASQHSRLWLYFFFFPRFFPKDKRLSVHQAILIFIQGDRKDSRYLLPRFLHLPPTESRSRLFKGLIRMSFPFLPPCSAFLTLFLLKWSQSRMHSIWMEREHFLNAALIFLCTICKKHQRPVLQQPIWKTRKSSIASSLLFHAARLSGICVLSILDMDHCIFHILCIHFRPWLAGVLRMFITPTSSMDTYTTFQWWASISSSSAVNGIFSSRDALLNQ